LRFDLLETKYPFDLFPFSVFPESANPSPLFPVFFLRTFSRINPFPQSPPQLLPFFRPFSIRSPVFFSFTPQRVPKSLKIPPFFFTLCPPHCAIGCSFPLLDSTGQGPPVGVPPLRPSIGFPVGCFFTPMRAPLGFNSVRFWKTLFFFFPSLRWQGTQEQKFPKFFLCFFGNLFKNPPKISFCPVVTLLCLAH